MSQGRATFLLALALTLGGALFDSPVLYVPGIALALLSVLTGVWVRRAADDVSMRCQPDAWSIVEGDPWPLLVEVRSGRMPLPGACFEHPLLSSAPAVRRGRSRRGDVLQVTLRFPHRGRWELGALTLAVTDPLGLHRRGVKASIGGAVLVLPRIEPLQGPAPPGALLGESASGDSAHGQSGGGVSAGGFDFEVDGLRPHRRGSPASRIHWPTVARTGELVEHRLLSGGESPPLVALDTTGADEGAVDCAVRAAASICHHLAGQTGCALLLPGEPRPLRIDARLRTWPEAHARLALVRPGAGLGALRAPREGTVFCVHAGAAPPPWAARLGRDAYLVGPAVRGPAAFEVCGCRAVRLLTSERAGRRAAA
jgi:uncharacterized protein (DUF58 family)